jgi:hypothetical protein
MARTARQKTWVLVAVVALIWQAGAIVPPATQAADPDPTSSPPALDPAQSPSPAPSAEPLGPLPGDAPLLLSSPAVLVPYQSDGWLPNLLAP